MNEGSFRNPKQIIVVLMIITVFILVIYSVDYVLLLHRGLKVATQIQNECDLKYLMERETIRFNLVNIIYSKRFEVYNGIKYTLSVVIGLLLTYLLIIVLNNRNKDQDTVTESDFSTDIEGNIKRSEGNFGDIYIIVGSVFAVAFLCILYITRNSGVLDTLMKEYIIKTNDFKEYFIGADFFKASHMDGNTSIPVKSYVRSIHDILVNHIYITESMENEDVARTYFNGLLEKKDYDKIFEYFCFNEKSKEYKLILMCLCTNTGECSNIIPIEITNEDWNIIYPTISKYYAGITENDFNKIIKEPLVNIYNDNLEKNQKLANFINGGGGEGILQKYDYSSPMWTFYKGIQNIDNYKAEDPNNKAVSANNNGETAQKLINIVYYLSNVTNGDPTEVLKENFKIWFLGLFVACSIYVFIFFHIFYVYLGPGVNIMLFIIAIIIICYILFLLRSKVDPIKQVKINK